MPSQQSSFKGTLMVLIRHVAMAAMPVFPTGPSKMPQPCAQAYSVPDRLTPTSSTGWSEALTSRAP